MNRSSMFSAEFLICNFHEWKDSAWHIINPKYLWNLLKKKNTSSWTSLYIQPEQHLEMEWSKSYLLTKVCTFMCPITTLYGFRLLSLEIGYKKSDPHHLKPYWPLRKVLRIFLWSPQTRGYIYLLTYLHTVLGIFKNRDDTYWMIIDFIKS